MTKLLDDSDFLEIRSAINDVVETFAQKPIIYSLTPEQTLSRFGRDMHNVDNKTKYSLLGLVVFDPDRAQVKIEDLGKYNFSIGYVLFGWDYLDSEGLILNTLDENNDAIQRPIFEAEKDNIQIDGIDRMVLGVNVAGQLKDKEAVVKVYFKNDLTN